MSSHVMVPVFLRRGSRQITQTCWFIKMFKGTNHSAFYVYILYPTFIFCKPSWCTIILYLPVFQQVCCKLLFHIQVRFVVSKLQQCVQEEQQTFERVSAALSRKSELNLNL